MLRAKKCAKSKKPLPESEEKLEIAPERRDAGGDVEETEKNQQVNPISFTFESELIAAATENGKKVKYDCDWGHFNSS